MPCRPPSPPLRPFVRLLWASGDSEAAPAQGAGRERLLPTGAMHLAFRTAGDPVRVFASPEDPSGRALGHAVVGGARAAPYLRDLSPAARSVGAMLEPGAARLLFGATADELSGRHTALGDLWGPSAASEARERIALAGPAERRLAVLEALLLARLPRVRGLHPAVAEALSLLSARPDVRAAVARSGYSHRRFIALFREAVGLAPKLWCRVRRFQAALSRIRGSAVSLAEVAAAAGYADQAHLNRDFAELAGLSPGRYRSLSPRDPNHVPVR
jgi:AraC-like DNA-binding protein